MCAKVKVLTQGKSCARRRGRPSEPPNQSSEAPQSSGSPLQIKFRSSAEQRRLAKSVPLEEEKLESEVANTRTGAIVYRSKAAQQESKGGGGQNTQCSSCPLFTAIPSYHVLPPLTIFELPGAEHSNGSTMHLVRFFQIS